MYLLDFLLPGLNLRNGIVAIALILSVAMAGATAAGPGFKAPPLSPSAQKNSSGCYLRVAWTEWKPAQYLNESGQRVGIQFELIDKLAQKLRCRLEYIQGNWSQNLSRIEEGDADLMANATISEARKQYAWFSIPYRRDNFGLYVRAEDKARFDEKSLTQLLQEGFRLGLTANYIYGAELDKLKQDKRWQGQIVFSKTAEDNILLAAEGKIDGFFEDPFMIAFKLRSHDLNRRFARTGINIEGMASSFIFSKATVSQSFVQRFNLALKELMETDPLFRNIWFRL